MILAVPGWATILLLFQLAAAVVSTWLAWPAWAAAPVTLLAAATLVMERRRWRWLVCANRLANWTAQSRATAESALSCTPA